MPRISVIMGVYNIKNEKMAEESIRSILNQSFSDFEFIICDDGSTDNTFEILEKLTKGDLRVRLIRNETNSGLACSLNHCLEYAVGEYVARMDVDDISYLNRFERQLSYMEKHSDLAFCGTWADLFDDHGIWGVRKKKERPVKEDLLFGPSVIHATILIRRSILEQTGGYSVNWDTTRAEDYELYMRLYAEGYFAGNMQESLYQIREDKDAFNRRQYKYRIQEAHVRMVGFKRLKLYPIGFVYVLKPLAVGLIPQSILKSLRREKIKKCEGNDI